jgi:hypothetical protein
MAAPLPLAAAAAAAAGSAPARIRPADLLALESSPLMQSVQYAEMLRAIRAFWTALAEGDALQSQHEQRFALLTHMLLRVARERNRYKQSSMLQQTHAWFRGLPQASSAVLEVCGADAATLALAGSTVPEPFPRPPSPQLFRPGETPTSWMSSESAASSREPSASHTRFVPVGAVKFERSPSGPLGFASRAPVTTSVEPSAALPIDITNAYDTHRAQALSSTIRASVSQLFDGTVRRVCVCPSVY